MSHTPPRDPYFNHWPLGYVKESEQIYKDVYTVGMARMDKTRSLYKTVRQTEEQWKGYTFLTLTFRSSYCFVGPIGLHNRTGLELAKNMHRIAPRGWVAFPELMGSGMLHWHLLFKTNNLVTLKSFRGHWLRKYGTSKPITVKPTRMDVLATYLYIRKESRSMIKVLKMKRTSHTLPLRFLSETSFKLLQRHTAGTKSKQTAKKQYDSDLEYLSLEKMFAHAPSPAEEAERSEADSEASGEG